MKAKERKPSKGYKYAVKAAGPYVLDYVESLRDTGRPFWFIGRGNVPGNTTPIPSGLHHTPRKAWQAAAEALGLTAG